jgi:adenine C2-methylase RlmN of 23S rRNA A2503 and tRNA A37
MCRYCYLTRQNQRSFQPATLAAFAKQADYVLNHYDQTYEAGGFRARRLLYDFMSRGEPLLNPTVVNQFGPLHDMLMRRAEKSHLQARINISTILPKAMIGRPLWQLMPQAHLYYSLYTMNETKKREWMPQAAETRTALAVLHEFEQKTNHPIVFHWPVIRGFNDDLYETEQLARTLKEMQFQGRFHLIRFNPPPGSAMTEADVAVRTRVFQLLSAALPGPSKQIERVGEDVFASCGQFIPK